MSNPNIYLTGTERDSAVELLVMPKLNQHVRIQTTDSQLRQLNGLVGTVTRVITEPDESHDSEVLPMYEVTTAEGVNEFWSDELEDPSVAFDY